MNEVINSKKIIGKRIKELRENANLTMNELVNKINNEIDKKCIYKNIKHISGKSTISQWENGYSYPRPQYISILGKVFDVSPFFIENGYSFSSKNLTTNELIDSIINNPYTINYLSLRELKNLLQTTKKLKDIDKQKTISNIISSYMKEMNHNYQNKFLNLFFSLTQEQQNIIINTMVNFIMTNKKTVSHNKNNDQ